MSNSIDQTWVDVSYLIFGFSFLMFSFVPNLRGKKLLRFGSVVLIILGIVGFVSKPSLRSTRSQTINAMEKVSKAANEFYDRCGRFPSNEEGTRVLVMEKFECAKWTGKILPELPKDAWSREFKYNYEGFGNIPDFISFGADGVEGGSGEDADIYYLRSR